jgi:hypothetical protein
MNVGAKAAYVVKRYGVDLASGTLALLVRVRLPVLEGTAAMYQLRLAAVV